MNKLRRFFFQNKYQVLGVLGIIVLIIVIIQLMNLFARRNNDKELKNNNTTVINGNNNENNKGLISDKSAVTGSEVSKTQLESATTAISSFLEYCNNQKLDKAYDLLTDECKKQMYSSLDIFKQSYYQNVFNGEKKNYTIENWVKDTYRVNITGDLLATGKDDGYSKLDYITVKKSEDEYKLNINNYIGYTEINKKTTENNISINVISKNTYKDYEEYTISATNNTENVVQLDNISNTDTLYLEDSKGVKYPYYNHELTVPMVTIPSGQTKEVTIKFYSSYVSTKKIERIVFSSIILKNGQLSEKTKFNANI